MGDLGPVGVVAAVVLLAQTIIAAVFAARNRRGDAAWRWRRRMEPVHLDLLDWASSVQMWAAARGQRDELPPLPTSLHHYLAEDDEPPEDLDVLRRRRDGP